MEIKAIIKKEEAEIVKWEDQIKAITSHKQLEERMDLLSFVKGKRKELEKKEDEITKPLNEALKSARELFRPIKLRYTEVEDKLKSLILSYKKKIEAEEQAKKAEIVKEVESGNLDFDKAGAKIEKLEQKVEAFNTRKIKDIEITDESLIPKEYWIIDMVRLRKDALTGKEIKGVAVITKEIVL